MKGIEPEKPISLTIGDRMLSSIAGSLITAAFVTPFDVVKIRLQVQEKVSKGHKCICFRHYSQLWDNLCHCCTGSSCTRCAWHKSRICFNGTWDAFLKITKHEGLLSLWRGFFPSLLIAVPSTAIYFTTYEQLRDFLSTKMSSESEKLIPAIAGVSARVLAVSLISPVEFLRTKVQSEKISYSAVFQSTLELVNKRGYLSLWHGYVPSLLRDTLFSATYWMIYERLKKTKQDPTFYHHFIFGSMAGATAAAITLPFDVIKSQRQAELGEAALLDRKVQTSTFALISKLYKKSGTKSLFAGFIPRMLKVPTACAIMISSYEYGKKYFQERRAHNYVLTYEHTQRVPERMPLL